MNDIINFIFFIIFYLLTNFFIYKKYNKIFNFYFSLTSTIGAIVSPIWCVLIIDKLPNLIILIIAILLFQIFIIYYISSRIFDYTITTKICILGAIYFLVISSCYFGKYYLHNDLIVLPEAYNADIIAIENKISSLRLRIFYLQQYYFCIGFKYFFSFPEHSYTNYVFIVQFIIGKLFDVIIFANIGNYIMNRFRLSSNNIK